MSAEGAVHSIVMSPGVEEFFIALNTLTIAAIIYVAGKKGIVESLKSRAELIRKRLVDSKVELDRYRADIERSRAELASLETTKTRIISETEEEGRKLSHRLVQEANITAQRILEDAKLGAEQEFKSAAELLKGRLVAEAVGQAREQMLGSSKKDVHEALLNKFLGDLSVVDKVKSDEDGGMENQTHGK